MSSGNPSSTDQKQGFFPQTRWTLVLQMQDAEASRVAVDALNQLCQMYWQPVYVYIRTWNKSDADAKDLTQGFFASILSKGSLDSVAPEKGKLRTFLLVAVKRFLANEHERESALKRGGGNQPISIDAEWADGRFRAEPASHESPDVLFERQWALTVLERVVSQLREGYAAKGKAALFDALKFTISPGAAKRPLAEIAADHGISESSAKVVSHRLRQRYRKMLHDTISDTIAPDGEVEEEIRYLMGIFS